MLLKSKAVQKLGGGRLERIGTGILSRMQNTFLGSHKPQAITQLIQKIRSDLNGTGPMANEAYMIYSAARAAMGVEGAMAEVGVFTGGSARMICEAKGDRPLMLFDTFAGLPPGCDIDGDVFKEHQYACSRDRVEGYLKTFPNISYHEGIFPDSIQGDQQVHDTRFAFAHFDVDLYEGTKACLEFFYPRMNPGGIMMTHDYSVLDGVSQAFDEFIADKPESLIELPTTQCMIVKR